ncbi:Glutaminase 1 [Suttonella ornithocola]|uniref:glutaminase n=2 Tax=Suttonella ornithocola TaxID=279832 RepID=A0A380MYX1_9GAMM|nr:Glutaminase 1 [Suttonella ornithocola]
MEACDIYTHQCSTLIDKAELATLAETLANQGKNPISDEKVIEPKNIALFWWK